MKQRLVALGVGLLLVGCSSSEFLSDNSDWYSIGYRDGVKGQTQRSFQDLAEHGQVNHADYDQGYLVGVQEYCNPAFAYQIGLSGSFYEGVCEGIPDAQKFRMEWQRGWNQRSGNGE